MLTLYAHYETTFYPALAAMGIPPKQCRGKDVVITNPDGTVRVRFPHYRKNQPDKRDRYITLNCYRWRLVWDSASPETN